MSSAGPASLRVFSADDVDGYSLPGSEGIYASQMLIGAEGVGSMDLQLHRFTLHAHQRLDGEVHPDNDEAYYVLSGDGWVHLGGSMPDGAGGVAHPLRPGTVVFMAAGIYHRLENRGDAELVVLSMWPRIAAPGGNKIAEGRRAAHGTSFLLREVGV